MLDFPVLIGREQIERAFERLNAELAKADENAMYQFLHPRE